MMPGSMAIVMTSPADFMEMLEQIYVDRMSPREDLLP
jgi:hypothetical protein